MMIKFLLVSSFLVLALFAARLGDSPRDVAVKRIAILVVFCLGSVAVVFPDLVTQVAQLVGVGRGTDLVLYMLVVVSVLIWLGTYKRLSRLDDQLTDLARAHAILATELDARHMTKADE
jgi:small membrane protein